MLEEKLYQKLRKFDNNHGNQQFDQFDNRNNSIFFFNLES